MGKEKKKLIGIIGASFIGTDPFHDKSWSGSSAFFFKECIRQEILNKAIGIDAPFFKKKVLMLRNFRFNRETWRQYFSLDTKYYNALTEEVKKKIHQTDFRSNFLQIGGVFNTPEVVQGRTKCFSYHDGNLAQFIKSPFFPKDISIKHIDKALSYEGNVYRSMDKIFTMSKYLRHSFINDFDVNEEKVVTIGGGINIEDIPQENFKRKYDNFNILFIGIRFFLKGGLEVLKAFKIVRDVFPQAKLHIVGPAKLNIPYEYAQNVVCHGFLSKKIPEQRRLLENLFEKVSLFVLPAKYEAFGIAPLEAMVHQIPCILVNNWAYPEMITPGKEGELVSGGNVDELAEKIIALLRSPDILERMGFAARNKVLEKYTWTHVVTKLAQNI